MRIWFWILILCGTLAPRALAAENWPAFRGPTGDGHTSETGLSLTWSETDHVAWKTALPGKAWSSPVIWDGQVWLANASEDGKQLDAVCIDHETGRQVHNIRVYDIAEPMYCIPFNSYASCTPAIEKDRIYVHYGSAGTACLDTRTGKTLWSRQDLPCDHHRAPASSPIIYGNLLIVAFDGFDLQYVVALDKRTGETVWKRDRNIDYGSDNGDVKKAYGTASVFEIQGKQQLIYPSAGATIAYDPLTGDELWRVNQGGMNVSARPLLGHGLLYLNTASGGIKQFALRVDGQDPISEASIEWKCEKGAPSRCSQLLVGDWLFMVSDQGIATCLNAQSGKVLWQQRLKGEFSASPIYAGGRIYFSNMDGATYVVAASDKYDLLATNELDAGMMASMAVYDKAIYLRTKTDLYRIQD